MLTIWIRAKPTLFTASIGYVSIFVRTVARNGESKTAIFYLSNIRIPEFHRFA